MLISFTTGLFSSVTKAATNFEPVRQVHGPFSTMPGTLDCFLTAQDHHNYTTLRTDGLAGRLFSIPLDVYEGFQHTWDAVLKATTSLMCKG